jgi:hypothetical protein
MFFIVNTTKQSLSIADLKLILGPRQGIDLDTKFSREESEKSRGIKTLISKGLISVKNKTEAVVESRFIQEVHTHNHNEPIDAEKIKTEIVDGLKEALAGMMPQQSSQPNINMEDLAKLISSMSPQGQQVPQVQKAPHDDDVQVNEGVLADIHSRTVSKMVEGVESGDINCEASTTDNDIDENIDELEDLLG